MTLETWKHFAFQWGVWTPQTPLCVCPWCGLSCQHQSQKGMALGMHWPKGRKVIGSVRVGIIVMVEEESLGSACRYDCTFSCLWRLDVQLSLSHGDVVFSLFYCTYFLYYNDVTLYFKYSNVTLKERFERLPSVLWCCWLGGKASGL